MTRLWPALRPGPGPDDGGAASRAPGHGSEAEFLAVDDLEDILPPYPYRPHRPWVQTVARLGLWAAVAIGCLGGVVGLARPAAEPVEAVADDGPAGGEVPGTVASFAELVVEEWLTAGDDGGDRLADLFVEPPAEDGVAVEDLTVDRVTTIGGHQMEERYWVVSVAAEVVEPGPDGSDSGSGEGAAEAGLGGGGDPGDPDAEPPVPVTWYVEVAVVGDERGGLAALTTPAVMAGPPEVEPPYRPSRPQMRHPDGDDDVAATVEGFLAALLTGRGDPSRYLAPRVVIPVAEQPPFAEIEIDEMAVEELDSGEIRVWVTVRATTPGGARHVTGYELTAVERVDRWEILDVSSMLTFDRAREDRSGGGSDTTLPSPAGTGETTDRREAPAEPVETTTGQGTDDAGTATSAGEPFRWEPET